ncbi:MAG TPA: aminotransferase class V-fold PLP-dependent enzyme, partial [Longimicrobiales bacterium]|nr:aminotransferase class V-fold PLP-dependent enzyme [Longimicrobiales bacterium]
MIYLDHAATTPLRPEAREAMLPWLGGERFGNPSSVHARGRDARGALEEARQRIAAALGAQRGEIVFTAGGTEADALAVLGAWRQARRASGSAGAVACSAVEHPGVLRAAQQAAHEGAELLLVGVDEDGRVLDGALEEV